MIAKVLIADPDEPLCNSYQSALLKNGFDVAVAIDGTECVALLCNWKPDLLVLDPDVFGGAGHGVLAALRERTDIPPVAVLVVASSVLMSVGDDLYDESAFAIDDCNLKPLPPRELVVAALATLRRYATAK